MESLAQLDHDSFEVIVSNNSSTDHTEAVGKEWVERDQRFKYIRTSEKLCMSDHWDYALRFVEGDYFLYVGDDDSFDRNILKVLDHHLAGEGAEGIYWRQANYYHSSWFDKSRAGRFYIPPFTARKWAIDAHDAIKQMFELRMPKTFPIGTSFCFKTSIARDIVKECGVFFVRPYPDYTSTMIYLPSIARYLYVDMALSIIGKSIDSNAAAFHEEGSKKRQQEFLREHNGRVYPHVPLNYHVISNGIAESVKAVQELRSAEFSSYELDMAHYFRSIYFCLKNEQQILENENGKHEFWKGLMRMPPKEQIKVATYVLRAKAYSLRQGLKSGLSRNSQETQEVATADEHSGHICKSLPNISECSKELAEHNSNLGYF